VLQAPEVTHEVGYLLTEESEDVPSINVQHGSPGEVLADVHQPNEAACCATRNCKCASSMNPSAHSVFRVVDFRPVLAVRRRLDLRRFQIKSISCVDCVVRWQNHPP
jgi:hypothetical protein